MSRQVVGKGLKGGRVFARGGKEHLGGLQVDEDGNVFMAPTAGGFVDAEGFYATVVLLLSGLLDSEKGKIVAG